MKTFQTSDGLTLAYEDEGSGPPLLCLPGLTRNARDFDDLAPYVPDLRLLRLTSRGRGDSDWDENYANYSVPIETRDVLEFLDHIGLEKVSVLGTSRGGIVSMLMAAMAPGRLSSVVLNDVGPELEAGGLARIMAYLGKPPLGETYEDVAIALAATMGREFPDLDRARWAVQAERWFEEKGGSMHLRYDPLLARAVGDASAETPDPDLWPLFDALKDVPLGLIRGQNSDLLSEAGVAAMQARRPDMLIARVPNRGHVPLLDEPESLKLIREVLALK